MTRDEAIKIEMKQLGRHLAKAADIALIATANVDALIELGVLKVDEPKKTIRIANYRFTIDELDQALFIQNVGYKLVKE